MSQTSPNRSDNAFVEFLKRRWLAIVITILAIVFIVQNGIVTRMVTFNLLWIEAQLPIWLVALILFVAGAITGFLFARNRTAR